MSRLGTLFKYALYNQLRSRWLVAYTLLYFGVAFALLQFGADARKGVASLISVVLLINPAVAILYSAVFWYASSGFNQLMLMQPVRRAWLVLSAWVAVAAGLSAAFVIGTAAAFSVARMLDTDLFYLLAVGTLLNFAFCGLGTLAACVSGDRMRGIGAALGIWLYFALVHDGLVFLFLVESREYPVEGPSYALMALNPVDLSRLLLLLRFDFAALLGYTGSLLQRMAGSVAGTIVLLAGLLFWSLVPALGAVAVFKRRDL